MIQYFWLLELFTLDGISTRRFLCTQRPEITYTREPIQALKFESKQAAEGAGVHYFGSLDLPDKSYLEATRYGFVVERA